MIFTTNERRHTYTSQHEVQPAHSLIRHLQRGPRAVSKRVQRQKAHHHSIVIRTKECGQQTFPTARVTESPAVRICKLQAGQPCNLAQDLRFEPQLASHTPAQHSQTEPAW